MKLVLRTQDTDVWMGSLGEMFCVPRGTPVNPCELRCPICGAGYGAIQVQGCPNQPCHMSPASYGIILT